jgi:hypothetical protein
MTTDRAALVAEHIEHAMAFLSSCEWNDCKSEDDACDAKQALREALSLLSAEPKRPQDTLLDAFRAGFSVAQHETDKYGEYHGESVEDEYRAWAAMGVEPTTEEK